MKSFAIIFSLLFSIGTFSQDFRYGKISEDDFKSYATPVNPSDNATVIYKKQNIRFDYLERMGFVQINEIHERIIIHNKEGFDWATKKIGLYNRSSANSENLQSLKGYTYTLENGKVEKEKLRSDGMFEEIANKYWKNKSFTMPNVKEGCIIEYSYEVMSPYSQIDDIDIQYTIPVLHYELKITTPEYFVYNRLLNPKAAYNPDLKESSKNNSITFNNKERTGFSMSKTTFSQSTVQYKDNIISINATNIPALKQEPFVDNLDNYRAKLIMELTATKFPNEPVKAFSSTWENVTKTIYEDDDFGGQLKKTGYFENDLKAILGDESDDIAKVILIHDFVKSKMKWNGYYGYASENGVRKAYKDGVGNVGDINLMLISMLRQAGLAANPILISTKNNGIPLLPTRTGFNYVIAGVVANNTAILLDATQKYSTPNVLPIISINWLGRVIRNDESSDWVELTPTVPSKEVISLNIKLNPDLSASGKVRNQFTDYQAFRLRDRYQNYSNEQIVETLEKDKGELEISNLEIENMTDVSRPMLQSYEYSLENAMEEIGGKLYFSPLLFLAPKVNPFKEDKRNYPIDFVYPIADKYMISIMLPEGYTVETLPESAKFEYNGTEGGFTYMSQQNGSMLQISITFDLKKTMIFASEYEHFKRFYQFMIEKQTEKVVLKKA